VARSEWNQRALRLWVVSLVLILQPSSVGGWNRRQVNAEKIKTLVADLKKRLDISAEISIAVVPRNNLLASVEPARHRKESFVISLDAKCLAMLDDEDLPAVVAHELGHVWIFTHHPYLHTEELANSIAYRLVSMAALDRVYEKVRLLKIPPANLQASAQERGIN